MAENPVFQAHQQWIGLLQPEGLVVSATALTESDIPLPSDASTLTAIQAKLEGTLFEGEDKDGEKIETLPPFEILADRFLEWPAESLAWAYGTRKVPDSLAVHIPAFQVTLSPTHVLYGEDDKPLILVKQEPGSPDLTARSSRDSSDWDASHVQRMDRLLRDTGVQIGIVATDAEIHLIYAPKAENSGHIGFPLAAMRGVEGRKVVAALDMLLSYTRVLASYTPVNVRLPALLEKSREAQNKVSEELAEQVLGALYELIKGIQTADQDARGKVLGKYLREHPELVYHGLLTVLMRLIFLLFAEDKGVMPAGALWSRNYSVHGLFERLRDDAQKHGANMDKRYGAWGQLLTTFNLVFNGCDHPQLKMPARLGYLFDPKRYPFLSRDEAGNQPLVSDAIIHSVLRSLLVLGGERISYRALSVENIGVVYETMMGFSVYQAKGACVVLKGAQAPAACELDELMALEGAKRITFIEELTGWKPNAKAGAAIKAAKDQGEMLDALTDRIRRDITPRPLTQGGLTLQPGEERRKSGSHYTPQQLTRPLVAKAFEPHFKRMGDKPDPDAVLSMTVCDPAMGSGAFLVEATRQLSDKLLEAWAAYPDKDPCKKLGADDRVFVAMRMVAQRCIYGVDRNPAAVDLAKMSMWLLTISKDHPFTFMDHSLKHGDALVGMSKEQIRNFHWDSTKGGQVIKSLANLDREVQEAVAARTELQLLDADRTLELEVKLSEADNKMLRAKLAGDLLVYSWFTRDNDNARIEHRNELAVRIASALELGSSERSLIGALKVGEKPLAPFHWELEYPEVFRSGGFSVVVGNPPFAGTNTIIQGNQPGYSDYLSRVLCDGDAGRADLVAFFFRRAFTITRGGDASPGTCCLIATKSIRQGKTREAGLSWIRQNDGLIYDAQRRVAWPGSAAVVVATVALSKGPLACDSKIDGKPVKRINSFLLDADIEKTPSPLKANAGQSFEGFKIYGSGFIFEDENVAVTPLRRMQEIIDLRPISRERVKVYVGGEQLNSQPVFKPERYVIDFDDMTLEQASAHKELIEIVRLKVKPERDVCNRPKRRENWWQYAESFSGLRRALAESDYALVASRAATKYLSFSILPSDYIFSDSLVCLPKSNYARFAVLQSGIHEVWARLFGSSLGDQLRYTPTSCFENFPFPALSEELEIIGKEFSEFRNTVQTSLNLGPTALLNAVHDPNNHSTSVVEYRKKMRTLDEAVMEAYGVRTIALEYEFIGDFIDEDVPSEVRYTFAEATKEAILSMLFSLHADLLKAEKSTPPAAGKADTKAKKPKKSKDSSGPELF
jgi:hypothetical protein